MINILARSKRILHPILGPWAPGFLAICAIRFCPFFRLCVTILWCSAQKISKTHRVLLNQLSHWPLQRMMPLAVRVTIRQTLTSQLPAPHHGPVCHLTRHWLHENSTNWLLTDVGAVLKVTAMIFPSLNNELWESLCSWNLAKYFSSLMTTFWRIMAWIIKFLWI